MDLNNLDQYPDNQLWAALNESETEEKVEILLALATRRSRDGDHAQSASLAEQAANEAEKCMSNTAVENARYRQGLSFWTAKRYDEAISAFKLGVERYCEPDPKIELSKNQWGIASSLFGKKDYQEAATWAKISTESALAENAYSMAGLNKFVEAKALYLGDREVEALSACEEARSYRRIEQELDEVADIDAYMAQIHTYLKNYSEAANLLRNCLVLAEATSSTNIKYFSYRLGNSLIDLGEYDEARQHLERARDLYQTAEDHAALADCFYSLSLTYRGEGSLDTALDLTRSATSLWDALGHDNAYLKGLQRMAILLFSKEEYVASIEVNQRMLDFIKTLDEGVGVDHFGWALLRMVDCHQELENQQRALSLLEETDLFGPESDHLGNVWFYALKSRGLYAIGHHEEAMGVADFALSQTDNDEVDVNTAYLYEIKARVSLEQNRPDRERHLAHAIALLLAFGESDKAAELSEYFKPNFAPQKSDNILVDENTEGSGSGLVENPPGFGFMPN
jgi:tetratricopeptide (TPR) repeat protein